MRHTAGAGGHPWAELEAQCNAQHSLLRHKAGLERGLPHLVMPRDSSAAERAIRGPVISCYTRFGPISADRVLMSEQVHSLCNTLHPWNLDPYHWTVDSLKAYPARTARHRWTWAVADEAHGRRAPCATVPTASRIGDILYAVCGSIQCTLGTPRLTPLWLRSDITPSLSVDGLSQDITQCSLCDNAIDRTETEVWVDSSGPACLSPRQGFFARRTSDEALPPTRQVDGPSIRATVKTPGGRVRRVALRCSSNVSDASTVAYLRN